MKLFLLSLITITFFGVGASQNYMPQRPYMPIVYDGLTPIWYETTSDMSIIGDSLNGYNHFNGSYQVKPFIHDNRLYTVFKQNGAIGKWIGSYIECRDVASGKLIWDHSMGMFEGLHQQLIVNLYIQGDKLIVWSLIRKGTDKKLFVYDDVIIQKTELTAATGDFISNFHRPFDDTTAFVLTSYPFDRSLYYHNNENLKYIRFLEDSITYLKYYSTTLDSTGKFIAETTLPIKKYAISFLAKLIHKDTILAIELYQDPNKLFFRYLSPDLEEYKCIESDFLFDYAPANLIIDHIDINARKICFIDRRNTSNFEDLYAEYYIFDFDGNMLRKIPFKDRITLDNFKPIRLENTDSIYFLHGKMKAKNDDPFPDYYSTLNVFLSTPDDSLLLIKEFVPTDTLTFAGVYNIMHLKDDIYILHLVERGLELDESNKISEFDINAIYFSTMMVRINEKGEILNGLNQLTYDVHLSLYPNPAHDVVYLRSPDIPIDQIWLHDISGRQVLSKSVDETDTSFSVAGLSPGIYLLSITTADAKKSVRKVVVY
ncbi:MAG: T9SS type A sorting domain-containing protein [Saprospiraceae bacterium]